MANLKLQLNYSLVLALLTQGNLTKAARDHNSMQGGNSPRRFVISRGTRLVRQYTCTKDTRTRNPRGPLGGHELKKHLLELGKGLGGLQTKVLRGSTW